MTPPGSLGGIQAKRQDAASGVLVYLTVAQARAASQGLRCDLLAREGDPDLSEDTQAEKEALGKIVKALKT